MRSAHIIKQLNREFASENEWFCGEPTYHYYKPSSLSPSIPSPLPAPPNVSAPGLGPTLLEAVGLNVCVPTSSL